MDLLQGNAHRYGLVPSKGLEPLAYRLQGGRSAD